MLRPGHAPYSEVGGENEKEGKAWRKRESKADTRIGREEGERESSMRKKRIERWEDQRVRSFLPHIHSRCPLSFLFSLSPFPPLPFPPPPPPSFFFSVEEFVRVLYSSLDRLDILINNACQTVRRPRAYYEHLLQAESAPIQCKQQR